MMTGRFLETDNIFISVLSFLFTLEKRKKNYKGGNENSIKYEIIYL